MWVSRRDLLALLTAPLRGQTHLAAPAWRRYSDPATEFEVVLLTDPAFESLLPAPPAVAVDKRSRYLLYASQREQGWQPWWMDLSTGIARPLGQFEEFVPRTLTLDGAHREALFADGRVLRAVPPTGGRARELAVVTEGATCQGPLAPTSDGTAVFYVEQSAGRHLLRLLRLPKGIPATVHEQDQAILDPAPNPKRAMLLWRSEDGGLWVASFQGAGRRRIATPAGQVLEAHWSPDGQSILYLLAPEDRRQLNAIREQRLDTREDQLVALTSQFARFARNANGTVFLGASRSAASPAVLVLLRLTRREFTLCEHKASDPAMVNPIFTPNSQRVLFQSDRHGKPAIYMMNVEKLIEKTDS